MDADAKIGHELNTSLLPAITDTECSMWGAAEYLERTFSELTCDHNRSREILFSWMRYTENRHAEMEDAE